MSDLVFGDVNPSGKLPLTFPNKENEQDFTQSQWPGLPAGPAPLNAVYSEKLDVGYRWYATHAITPAFAFGHGLSYTTFSYSDVSVTPSAVDVTVTNTGSVTGKAVPQLYLGFPEASGEPPKQLKGFTKVALDPGATTRVSFPLTSRDKSVWDASMHTWEEQRGTFNVYVGDSSESFAFSGSFEN